MGGRRVNHALRSRAHNGTNNRVQLLVSVSSDHVRSIDWRRCWLAALNNIIHGQRSAELREL